MRNQGMSFHDRQQEELEMDNLLEAYGFSAAAIPGTKSPKEQQNQNQTYHMRGSIDPVNRNSKTGKNN